MTARLKTRMAGAAALVAASVLFVGLPLSRPSLAAQRPIHVADEAKPEAAQSEGAKAETPDSGIIAQSVRLEAAGDLTRLEFDLTGRVAAHAFVLTDPDRVIVDLPEVNFQVDPSNGRPQVASVRSHRGRHGVALVSRAAPLAGVVNSYRFGLFAPGRSRIVVDLAEPARIVRAESTDLASGGARLVIELAHADRASFAAAARQSLAMAPAPAVADQAPTPVRPDALPVVVLDAGHGGVDTGARGADGILEKDIVLEFVRALQAKLEPLGRYHIVLTRSQDVFIPLAERVIIARDAGAALFVSVHADTLVDEPSVSGATVYTVSDKASDAAAARVAEKENQSDAAAGLDHAAEEHGEVSDILYDLTRRETRAYSNVFARTLVNYFKEAGRLNKNPHRSAGFRVLKAPDVPSVLLELGYLSSDKDAPRLASAEWREHAAGAVADAIDRFFEARQPKNGVPAARADGPAMLEVKTDSDLSGDGHGGPNSH